MRVSASLVLYKTDRNTIGRLLRCVRMSTTPLELFILDNSPEPCLLAGDLALPNYQFLNQNLGYGKAHNLAMEEALRRGFDYHIILNPDIYFDQHTVGKLAEFMESSPRTGLVMPEVRYPDGEMQYLCKLLPTPMDLFGRRFLARLRYSRRKSERLEMRELGYDRQISAPWLSGCFMFLRLEVVRTVGGFDPRYFMYAEDLDLSRRIHERFETIYFPGASIVHDHAKESFKSVKMMFIHVLNVCRYFNKWGWIFDAERRRINRRALRQ